MEWLTRAFLFFLFPLFSFPFLPSSTPFCLFADSPLLSTLASSALFLELGAFFVTGPRFSVHPVIFMFCVFPYGLSNRYCYIPIGPKDYIPTSFPSILVLHFWYPSSLFFLRMDRDHSVIFFSRPMLLVLHFGVVSDVGPLYLSITAVTRLNA